MKGTRLDTRPGRDAAAAVEMEKRGISTVCRK